MTRLRIASKIWLGDNSVVVKAIRLVRGIVLLFFGILHAREAGSPVGKGSLGNLLGTNTRSSWSTFGSRVHGDEPILHSLIGLSVNATD